MMLSSSFCFNLVIEVLFFSRQGGLVIKLPCQSFQSRNRGSFLFKIGLRLFAMPTEQSFQSRNRGSFLFKGTKLDVFIAPVDSFNLVIEVLFFSRPARRKGKAPRRNSFNLVIEVLFFSRSCVWVSSLFSAGFQSRNRGSFLFKHDIYDMLQKAFELFQSRNRGSFLFKRFTQRPNILTNWLGVSIS